MEITNLSVVFCCKSSFLPQGLKNPPRQLFATNKFYDKASWIKLHPHAQSKPAIVFQRNTNSCSWLNMLKVDFGEMLISELAVMDTLLISHVTHNLCKIISNPTCQSLLDRQTEHLLSYYVTI